MVATEANNTTPGCYAGRGHIISRGAWFKNNPLEFTIPNLIMQIILFSIIERILNLILKPFGQPSIVAQMLGGVILGPSVLGRSFIFKHGIFPTKSKVILDPLARFGLIFIELIIGVRMDLSIMFKTGRIAVVIGILGNLFPMAVGGIVTMLLSSITRIDPELSASLGFIIIGQSTSTSPVVTNFLRDVKILNSELGRLATSSSVVSGLCSYSVLVIVLTVVNHSQRHAVAYVIGSLISLGSLMVFILFILRPAALWVNKRTPKGQPVKEIYIFATIVALMLCALIGEVIGLGYALGALTLAFAIPDGPSLGATLDDKIGTLNTVLFMPMFFTNCGLKTDMTSIDQKHQNVLILEMVLGTIFLAKATVITLILLYYKMSFRDALTLALVMNSKGLVEVAMYDSFLGHKAMTSESFTILIISSVIVTMIISYLVRSLYDPSKRYLSYSRRTIQHIGQNTELGVLACVHNQENVPTIIKILEASNPIKESPIHVCVLHLVKHVGRAASVLIAHNQHSGPANYSKLSFSSKCILKAFKHYREKHQFVTLVGFTGISPSDAMHEDVCYLASENTSLLIILPFHKQWLAGGHIQSSTSVRTLNFNVLAKAPCSVGILIDRSYICPSRSMSQDTYMYEIGTLFIGGADDQEALSYGTRMVNQTNVRLTVIHFVPQDGDKDADFNYTKMKIIDNGVLDNFRKDNLQNNRIIYKKELVSEGHGLVRAIRSVDKTYDLMMVGRRHVESPLMEGITEWTEYPELGIIGDILATPDFPGVSSVMVVQQQARILGVRQQSENY